MVFCHWSLLVVVVMIVVVGGGGVVVVVVVTIEDCCRCLLRVVVGAAGCRALAATIFRRECAKLLRASENSAGVQQPPWTHRGQSDMHLRTGIVVSTLTCSSRHTELSMPSTTGIAQSIAV